MPYTITHDTELDLVELTFIGSITGADLKEATTNCSKLQKVTGVRRFLVDGSDWDVVASAVDIYDLPDKQYWNERIQIETRIAVVLPNSARSQEAALFYENACQNRGWNAQVHLDRQSAVDWLTESIMTSWSGMGDG